MSSARDKGLVGLLSVGLIVLIVFCGTNLLFWNSVEDAIENRPHLSSQLSQSTQQSAGIDLITDDCTIPIITTLSDNTIYFTQENIADGSLCNGKCLAINSANNECVNGQCIGECVGACPGSNGTGCPDLTLINILAIYPLPFDLIKVKGCSNNSCFYIVYGFNQSLTPFLIGQTVNTSEVSIEMRGRLGERCIDLLDRSTPGVNNKCLIGAWAPIGPFMDGCIFWYHCDLFNFPYSKIISLQGQALADITNAIL